MKKSSKKKTSTYKLDYQYITMEYTMRMKVL